MRLLETDEKLILPGDLSGKAPIAIIESLIVAPLSHAKSRGEVVVRSANVDVSKIAQK